MNQRSRATVRRPVLCAVAVCGAGESPQRLAIARSRSAEPSTAVATISAPPQRKDRPEHARPTTPADPDLPRRAARRSRQAPPSAGRPGLARWRRPTIDGRHTVSSPRPRRPRARSDPASSTATPTASAEPAEPPARRRPRAAPRTAPGATKTAVLQALSGGDALTAGQVAAATGLGRGTVSTTLSKLAKSGEVTKAARGYQLAGQPTPGTPTDAAVSAENEQPGG